MIQVLADHCKLNTYLHKINVIEDPSCNFISDAETTKHLLFHCPLYHAKRINFRNSILK